MTHHNLESEHRSIQYSTEYTMIVLIVSQSAIQYIECIHMYQVWCGILNMEGLCANFAGLAFTALFGHIPMIQNVRLQYYCNLDLSPNQG